MFAKKKSRLLLALLLCFTFAPGHAAVAADKTVHVTLALICDIYEMTEQDGRGGYARLAGALKRERATHKNLIVAHAGDALSPSLFSGFDEGESVITLTNLLAPDIFVPGNHEFDFGEKVYLKRMREARFTVLAANLRDADGRRLPGHADVKWFSFEGVKIAVIGVTADDSPEKSSPGSLRFEATVPLVKRLAPELRAQGADLVVAVAHANRRQDLRLFNIPGLDVLLSGDDHDLVVLYDGQHAMAEAMSDGQFVTSIDLAIKVKERSDGRRSVDWRPGFRIIDTATVAPDPAVAARVEAYQQLLSQELDVALGKTATKLDSRETAVRMREAAIGNLIADAQRARLNADVAIMNGGGIRADKVYPAGSELTRRDVLKELPFGNKLCLVEMKGADLKQALENGYWYLGKANGRFAQISGARIVLNGQAVPGRRIVSVEIGGKPLDPEKVYKVAASDFITSGKEGYDVFKRAKPLFTVTDGPLIANVVMAYIRQQGTVSPQVDGVMRVE